MLTRQEIFKCLESIENKPQTTEELKHLLEKPSSEDKITCLETELPKYATHSVDKVWKIKEEGREYLTKQESNQFQRALVDSQYKSNKFQKALVDSSEELTKNSKEQTKISGQIGRKQNSLMMALITATIIIAVVSIAIQGYQLYNFNKSVEKQLQLNDAQIASLAPLNATVSLYVEPSEKIISADDIAQAWYNENGRYQRQESEVNVVIRNTGQMSSGRLNILNSDTVLFVRGMHIPSLTGLSSDINFTRIHLKGCYEGSDEPCNISTVPRGGKNITFEIICPFCTPGKFNQTIEFCFWYENSSICNYLKN